jgi:hypothetical protein
MLYLRILFTTHINTTITHRSENKFPRYKWNNLQLFYPHIDLSQINVSPLARKYLRDVYSPVKLGVYFLRYLPTAWWWGIEVRSATANAARVYLPFSWRTSNPFRSIYFAALCGAGELASGILANLARIDKGDISMIVVSQQAIFLKKANTDVIFTCEQGDLAFEAVQKALDTGEPQQVEMLATGRNTYGEVVATVTINWSYKVKSPK